MADQNGCTIRVVRKWQTPSSTISEFSIDDSEISGYILEPQGPSTTLSGLDRRIPTGTYNLDWYNSPSFGKILPRLSNSDVSKTRYILIHSGNFPAETLGCLMPGASKGANFVNSSASLTRQIIKHLQSCDINKSSVIITEEFN
jgi:hypothetical protein